MTALVPILKHTLGFYDCIIQCNKRISYMYEYAYTCTIHALHKHYVYLQHVSPTSWKTLWISAANENTIFLSTGPMFFGCESNTVWQVVAGAALRLVHGCASADGTGWWHWLTALDDGIGWRHRLTASADGASWRHTLMALTDGASWRHTRDQWTIEPVNREQNHPVDR